MLSKNNNKAVLATLALMLLSLSVASSIAMSKYPKIMQARKEVQGKAAVMRLMPPLLKALVVVLLR
jgi:hypothetical protein